MVSRTSGVLAGISLWLRRFSIAQRLTIGMIVLMVLMGAMVGMAWRSSAITQSQVNRLAKEHLLVNQALQEMSIHIARSRIELSRFLGALTRDLGTAMEHAQAGKEAIDRAVEINQDPTWEEALVRLQAWSYHYAEYLEEMQRAIQDGDPSLSAFWAGRARVVGEDILQLAQQEMQRSAQRVEKESLVVTRTAERWRWYTMITFGAGFLLAVAIVFLMVITIVEPITELAKVTTRMRAGDLSQRLTVHGQDELSALASSFNQMAGRLAEAQEELRQWGQELERKVAERTQELAEAVRAQQELLDTIQRMATPVVPALEGIIVMPLVGVIDAQRAEQIMDSLLEGVERYQARVAIIDITGVPAVDVQVAEYLLETVNAVRLLGARAILVGIRSEIAQALTGLDLDLSQVVTRSDLRSGMEYAMTLVGRG